jgi:hypothetical protein
MDKAQKRSNSELVKGFDLEVSIANQVNVDIPSSVFK